MKENLSQKTAQDEIFFDAPESSTSFAVQNGETQSLAPSECAVVPASVDVSACGQAEQAPSEKKHNIKRFFSAKKIATMGIMTALAFVVSLLDFPIFPAAPFLKLDFGNIFIMLTGFLFGPVEAVIVCVLKEALHIPVGTTGGVGELANIIITCIYLVLPATVYRFKKGIKVVIPCLIAATLIMAAVSLPVNRYINFPFFMGAGAAANFAKYWYFVLGFNLIKGAVISAGTCILYKTLSRLLKKF